MEITVGASIGFLALKLGWYDRLSLDADWMKFCAGVGAVLLTFLAGAELNPETIKNKITEVSVIGLFGFFVPFAGASLVAYYMLGWNLQASLLCGIALSTTSMAVVYSVMLEYGFNKTEYGKGILGACFINDLGTVIGLGIIFAPFTYKTVVFIAVTAFLLFILPALTHFLIKHFAYRTAAIRTKWILFVLLAMSVLALWSGSEAVLPAYLIGMALAKTMEEDGHFVRRLRTLTVGFLTPLYFLRAGALVNVPALVSVPLIFLLLFAAKVFSKIAGLYPAVHFFRHHKKEKWNYHFKKLRRERWYYVLLMSTGLTFGTISALFGLSHHIITREQYSLLVGVVIVSAVVPTLIANKFFLPRHLLEKPVLDDQAPDKKEIKKKM